MLITKSFRNNIMQAKILILNFTVPDTITFSYIDRILSKFNGYEGILIHKFVPSTLVEKNIFLSVIAYYEPGNY